MNKCDTKQNDLLKSLGPEYSIRYIDLERVIYRDFGNGYNVEISGTHTTSEHKTATIYLWFGEKYIVTSVTKVVKSDIASTVDKLYLLSCGKLKNNLNPLPRGWGGGVKISNQKRPCNGRSPSRTKNGNQTGYYPVSLI